METLELNESINEASVTRVGDATGVLEAGKRLKIETFPSGVEVLNYEVPTGKVVNVRVYICITETDV